MDGNKLLSKLGRLKDITSMKDVAPLSAAMFPGTHCPLMGAAMTVRGIKDAVLLIVGTDECAYYTKHMTLHSEEFGGVTGRCMSVVLDTRDVTFGCKKKLESAMEELVNEYHPRVVFLVTTCVVEIIGDDADSMADGLSEKYGIHVLPVHTEHFKCDNHLPGLERAITACFELMKKRPSNGKVNLLGQRMGSFETTELCHILKENNVEIGMELPCGCTVEEIEQAAGAKMNIVVNNIALPLAKKMKEAFGVPYVFFNKFTDPGHIYKTYQYLFESLELSLPQKLKALYENARNAVQRARGTLEGVTYIYGNTPFDCMEFNSFMVDMGMVPQIIQLSSYDNEVDRPGAEHILEKVNPYVAKSANIAPMQYIYDVLKPNLYLGHEYAQRLRKKGIAMVHSDKASGMLGFEVTDYIIGELVRAAAECREIREELGKALPETPMKKEGMAG